MLSLILVAVAILCVSALVVALLGPFDRAALSTGTAGALAGCGIGLCASLVSLVRGAESARRIPWVSPVGELHVGLDALSAFFLACVFTISALAAIYGAGYLQGFMGRRRLAPAIAFFNVLVAAMAAIVIARDGLLFLGAWEVMSVSSFFLVTYESDREEVRRAGMTYLIASQLGVVFLFLLFGLLSRHGGSLAFDAIAAAGPPRPALAGACFLVALLGFGTKAGMWPLHTWLPDAHPAAPSHVSALMSGVMIKMGIYGLLRTTMLLGRPEAWWGGVLLAVGAISGVTGVLHALSQHDLKRLLAYHSVENIGIITLGIGVGLLGQSGGHPQVAFLGYGGALLHVLNHGLFKGLLFQGAGSVLHATGTRDIESLGGLYRRMPVTASTFLVGAVAISGLPPLNGFVSEWLIYVGAFRASDGLPPASAAWALTVIPTLALIGGLAAACFVKAFGIVFTGEPRTELVARAHEATPAMQVSMMLGAALCILIGFWPAAALQLVERPASVLAGYGSGAPGDVVGALGSISRAAIALLLLVGLLTILRAGLLRAAEVRRDATWGCAYGAPSPRMQYSAASFAEPLLSPFAGLLHRTARVESPRGYFPTSAHYEEHLGDLAGERFLMPLSRRLLSTLSKLRVVQQGRVQTYLGYVFLTVVALLLWQLVASLGR
jgi:hydrogenase-4 component B